jgi:hypothetical protein
LKNGSSKHVNIVLAEGSMNFLEKINKQMMDASLSLGTL